MQLQLLTYSIVMAKLEQKEIMGAYYLSLKMKIFPIRQVSYRAASRLPIHRLKSRSTRCHHQNASHTWMDDVSECILIR